MIDEAKKILVAEDNSVMADILRFILERAEYSVTIASNGQEALERLHEDIFDLVIADYQMPKIDGLEMIRTMRQDARHAITPAILCSAKGYEVDAVQLKEELGIDLVVFKPFSPRQLLKEVQARLEQETSLV